MPSPATVNMERTMRECIEACQRCHDQCLTDVQRSLTLGADHAAPAHVALLIDCARVCATTAELMLTGSRFHRSMCGVCAQVCEGCAQQCEMLGELDDCARACRDCAQRCEQMGLGAAEAG